MRVLVCGDHPQTRGGIANVMGIVERRLEDAGGGPANVKCEFLDPRGREDWTVRSNLSALARITMHIARGVDLVHLNTACRGSTYRNMFVAAASRCFHTPYVVHLHGGGYREFFANVHGFVRLAIRSYLAGAARVIVLTDGWRQFVVDRCGVPADRVTTVRNGVEAPPAGVSRAPASERPAFVFAGRMTAIKGVPLLVEAFSDMRQGTEARLVLAGGSADLETRACLVPVPEGVEVCGWLEHDETLRLMARARAVVLPSWEENMPLTILEAMSVGTAVIASRVGGIPDIVDDGVEGLLIKPGDVQQLREAMIALGRNAALAESMGDRGRIRWMSKHGDAQMVRGIVQVWQDACPMI